MVRPDKAAAVAELADKFRESGAVLLTEYRGLTVAELRTLRRSLAGNASFSVVKNTLAAIAAKEAGFDVIADELTGPSAIAFVTGEPVEAAKAIREFSKTNDKLVIKAGVLEGKLLSKAEVLKLADLESREVLLAKSAGVLKAAMYQAAYLFTAPASKAVRTVEALREKQAAGAEN
ncbi:50S ribosomal protein L10 [Buchananella hordeovulneris]|uniref:Large ribosomal subunit protein uL10 n=1 Tax=Buchananella hordeovulneris TaxID=52770 RepID=A0A1Q5PTW0_9ACTO|nr:50S ribosomal protein L10 [Buchananella hordeovulneris]MDO5079857.1 50S ribosomal protein L10 [Buchananella hordeovulneris]OKL51027.1 50S ribosomal protein L10 [Buchananella hordeovulneris]RRD43015.1 50S ribosomal protein L10 [Buchananella hordeovulneris]RRD52284.1 50S ribosomal protein L10 [Buchananella hordeovulneris]